MQTTSLPNSIPVFSDAGWGLSNEATWLFSRLKFLFVQVFYRSGKVNLANDQKSQVSKNQLKRAENWGHFWFGFGMSEEKLKSKLQPRVSADNAAVRAVSQCVCVKFASCDSLLYQEPFLKEEWNCYY